MSKFYNKLNCNFTQISNSILLNSNISGTAFKLYSYIVYRLSTNPEWVLYEQEIKQHFQEGDKRFKTAKQELMEEGYIKQLQQKRRADGTMGAFEYEVYSEPHYLSGGAVDGYAVMGGHNNTRKKEQLEVINIKEKNIKKQKPTLSEIQDYIIQENLPMNANDVFSYYEKNNWTKKNGKEVINWKSTIKNWNRPTIAERKADIENISFEVKQKEKTHTPYEKLQKIITNKGITRNDYEIENIVSMKECQEWIKQAQINNTFEATLEDIQNHFEAQNVLKNAYISFLEKFKTSKEQIENDIRDKLPLFLKRCENLRYTAVIEGLTTISKNDYNDYMKKQSENKLPFISHFDYTIQRIEFIDSEITRLWKRLNEFIV